LLKISITLGTKKIRTHTSLRQLFEINCSITVAVVVGLQYIELSHIRIV